MQTQEYAHSLIGASVPSLDDEVVEERVAGRLKRQEALTERKNAMFGFVLYEATLRTVLGSGWPANPTRRSSRGP
ncbi:Scr1 family TA system antitoxin-like transcriptional regulator [Streptomyces sp. NPDC052225]|uniref:Scr1 family TA system antitoxin-like transcriptional regulator n=1 Tax=Streptomyces sp. NPDC052225 TaxID=3154949 RepID=UPI00342EEFC3